MALVDNDQLESLADTILSDSDMADYKTGTDPQRTAYDKGVEDMKKFCTHIMTYIVTELELRGIKIKLDDTTGRVIEAYAIGVGTNGGALASATGGPVAGSVKSNKADVGTQNNDGRGLVQ